jgi:hypothetical protein
MQFTKKLHDGIRNGKITCSIRIWGSARVRPGGRYKFGEGQIEVDSIEPITRKDITPALARRSGFDSVAELLRIAKHGAGQQIFLIKFHYLPPL